MTKIDDELDELCKRVFNTEDGKRLLAILVTCYLSRSVIKDSPELTYYELGRKEFLEGLVRQVENRQELNMIIENVEENYNE